MAPVPPNHIGLGLTGATTALSAAFLSFVGEELGDKGAMVVLDIDFAVLLFDLPLCDARDLLLDSFPALCWLEKLSRISSGSSYPSWEVS